MTTVPGPRGCRLFVEPAADVPLVWIRIAARGGAAADPVGVEGFMRHVLELSRRGAGTQTRVELDESLDSLGASLDASISRDAATLSALCLSRHAEKIAELAGDVLARPRLDEDEHRRLLRESASILDDLRDDDGELAARFFTRYCAPGHGYARPSIGTVESLDRIELDMVRAEQPRMVSLENLVIGFAGDVDETRATRLAEIIVADLETGIAAPEPDIPAAIGPEQRQLYIVDKPKRGQSQILIGHPVPAYGTDDFRALTVVEIVFGGTFTSRLMQEIRVRHGWSYGAGCMLGRARGDHWFRIYLAPSAEATPDALARTHEMYRELVEKGITADELEFAKSYLAGSLPFAAATASQRMGIAVRNSVFGLPDDFHAKLPSRIDSVTLDGANDALRRHLHPDRAITVVVTTAETMTPRLASLDLGEVSTIAYDSY